ncbi:PAPS_reduct domain-containing protein [Meloidogyne graminicola]|uniref:FAD synthase n=1 Tax=Meloidogyne graminicola TaxID=189291 RepID=A0A8S9ZSK7_9BILA|nr:PAPS_reduct domain-containing protein [Meloidogyne graminicola]
MKRFISYRSFVLSFYSCIIHLSKTLVAKRPENICNKNCYIQNIFMSEELPNCNFKILNGQQKLIKFLKGDKKEFSNHFDLQPWENAYEKLEAFQINFKSKEIVIKLKEALKTIEEILDKYSLEQISLSFNGGKDCTLLLHLLRACVNRKYGENKQINAFYIKSNDEFPEIINFVHSISEKYNLNIFEFNGPLKTGLIYLKSQKPEIIATLMGSRSTDPKAAKMKSKCEWTEPDWPPFLRVCPLLDMTYSDVWILLRSLCIPYCSLYDQGYSSLGERSKTMKNPHLIIKENNGNEKEKYLPAYMLDDEKFERIFREDRASENEKPEN